ncbi:hypothetical protein V6N13_088787 [Hibiscus sabdariffa]
MMTEIEIDVRSLLDDCGFQDKRQVTTVQNKLGIVQNGVHILLPSNFIAIFTSVGGFCHCYFGQEVVNYLGILAHMHNILWKLISTRQYREYKEDLLEYQRKEQRANGQVKG